jgi:hypothetical protein
MVVIEIPHQRPASAWEAASRQRVIDLAYETEDTFEHRIWSMAEALECFGEREEIPEDLLEILDARGFAGQENETFMSVDKMDSEYDAAVAALGHDLSSIHVIPRNEALEYAESMTGHKSIEAKVAVRELLNWLEE